VFKQSFPSGKVQLSFDFTVNGQSVLVTDPKADLFDLSRNVIGTYDLVWETSHYVTYITAPATLGSYFAVGRGEYSNQNLIALSQFSFNVISSGATELATLEEAKNYLRITDFSEDEFIKALVLSASAAILSFTQLKIGSTSVTEEYLIKDCTSFGLRYFPLIDISSLSLETVGTGTTSSDSLTEDEDYMIDRNIGLITFFSPATGLLKCSYTYGLTEIPAPLKLACLKLVSALYNLRESEGFSSRRLLSNTENYLRDEKLDIFAEIRSIVQVYKRSLV